MTEPTFIGIVLAAISALGVITGGLFIGFAWVTAMFTAADSMRARVWRHRDWGLVLTQGIAGLISIAIGAAAAGVVHAFGLMPFI